ncbi:hypothetical protein C1752_08846 [Acaryochloris thomasi RCC1774]|uniref:T4-like virus tail tube protein gp19 n=1 Tax=Acaryochloris thomasi RCC1774 TaxID=1764569 RepID=A0A2W1JIF2_9CYAN|nr:phage tail protein [Acaryochloris thomasi]PZD70852.1 hypothetical protein C1752_08846 [Acaryochloris thomasi RCC1774]
MAAEQTFCTSFGLDLGGGAELPVLGVQNLEVAVKLAEHNTGTASDGSFGSKPVPGPRNGTVVTVDFALTKSRDVYDWFNTVNPKYNVGATEDPKDLTLYGYDGGTAVGLELVLEGAYPIRWSLSAAGIEEEGIMKESVDFVVTNVVQA